MDKKMNIAIVSLFALLAAASTASAGVIDPARGYLSPDKKVRWYNGAVLPMEGKGYPDTEDIYTRLPNRMKEMVSPVVWKLSRQSAGLSICFTTDSTEFWVKWNLVGGPHQLCHMADTGSSGVDVYRWTGKAWRYTASNRGIYAANTLHVGKMKPGTRYMVNLPPYNGTKAFVLGIPEGKKIETMGPRSSGITLPVVFYGTSITQGCGASRPGMAYPSIIGRMLDVPIVNLGFSGSGRMEPALADILSGIKASAYVLDCHWNMTESLIRERFEPFVRRLHKNHPDTPILLVEDSTVFGVYPTPKGRVSRDIYDRLKAENPGYWKNVFYLPSKDLIPDDGEASVDGIHMTDYGMVCHARAFSKVLKVMLGLE